LDVKVANNGKDKAKKMLLQSRKKTVRMMSLPKMKLRELPQLSERDREMQQKAYLVLLW